MDHRHWRLLNLSLALALAMGATACRSSEPSDDAGRAPGDAAVEEATQVEQPVGFPAVVSKVPLDTHVAVTIGEPESLDPAWTYETTGAAYEANIYDSLLYFDREQPDAFVPALATEWDVSPDGLTYTFVVREGVTFHEGGTLEPHDVAYSLQRAMLQDRADGPMWLYLEPLLATSSIESLALQRAGLPDDGTLTLDDVPAETAIALCEAVKDVVTADDEAGTVTIKVRQPTPWLLQLLAQPWGAALDMEWMAEQGDWDGECATWTEYHNPQAQETVLFDRANGTGPYRLASWKKGQEITLDAHEGYWRTEPVWPGGPSGPARIKHLVFKKVDEWGTRFAMLSAGEADSVVVPRAEIGQVEGMVHTQFEGGDESAPATVLNPDGTLKLFTGYPTVQATVAMFTFEISDDSEFIGSGQLDGRGIPPDFFTDIQVRRGLNYCFDWDTYIAEGLQGEGFQSRGPVIRGLQGYAEDSPVFTYDLDRCRSELAQAWDGRLAEVGFQMTLVYNQGNDTRKMAAEILAENLALADPKYQASVQQLEWPSFLLARKDEKLPIAISGWLEDYHDASNWVHPFMHSKGAYARAQHFPAELQTLFDQLIEQAVLETDETARDELYGQLQQLAYDHAINIFLEQATGRAYMNRQVTDWFYNPLAPGTWYYALGKESP